MHKNYLDDLEIDTENLKHIHTELSYEMVNIISRGSDQKRSESSKRFIVHLAD